MIITWQGDNYFKCKTSTISLIFNPYSLSKKSKAAKAKAELILFSDPSRMAEAKFDQSSFVISSPGEYEFGGVFVYGRQINGKIIYNLIIEEIKIAFLGEYGHDELSNHNLELLEGSDILILPIAGGELTSAKEAGKIIRQVEPRIIIPSCFNSGQLADFVKEIGLKPETGDKFSIKQKDLPQDEMKLVVLKSDS
ncbi:MAG: MBL fold metallo-hydrolase [Patescibacteria group bacterium]|nr:MBL fold metallo-hydrolase [Patescibacteria group bacterium]